MFPIRLPSAARSCVVFLSLIAGPALAVEPLTLPQLVGMVREGNPLIEQARQLHVAAQANVPIALASANPQVGLIQNPYTGSPLSVGNSTGFSQTFTQAFQLFGKKALAGDIAQKQAESVGTVVDSTRLQLIAQLKSAFYLLIALQEQQRVSSENIERLEQIKRIAKVQYANNAAAYVEFLNAQVTQSSAENDLFALERQIQVTRDQINTLIGRDPGEALVVQGELPALSAREPNLADLTERTLRQNPVLKGSTLQLNASEKGVDYAKKAYLPDFQIIATHNSSSPPWGLAGNSYGLEVDVVLPTWFSQKEKAGVDQAQANLMAARAGDMALRQQVLLGVASAYNGLLQARKQLEFLSNRQLPQARAAWRLALQNYATNNNQAFPDLLMAQNNLRGAELGRLQAEMTVAQAWAALEAAVGSELDN